MELPRNGSFVDPETFQSVPGDEKLFVKFYRNGVTGKDHISITVPGDNLYEIDEPVHEMWKDRFRPKWEAYEQHANQLEGKALVREMPWVDEATARILEARNVFTVEHLAHLSDDLVSAVGPGTTELRQKARKYVVDQEKVAGHDEVMQRFEAQNQTIEDLQETIRALQAQMAATGNAPEPKRRGRQPRKEAASAGETQQAEAAA